MSPGAQALVDAHDVSGRSLRVRGAQKVDVVPVGAQHLDLELVALLDLQADARQFGNDLRAEQGAAVLDGEHQVVVHIVDAVAAVLQARAGRAGHDPDHTRPGLYPARIIPDGSGACRPEWQPPAYRESGAPLPRGPAGQAPRVQELLKGRGACHGLVMLVQ